MRTRVRSVLAVVSLAGAPWLLAQERDWSKVVVVPQKVTDGIYMITAAGENLGVSVGPDAVFLALCDEKTKLIPGHGPLAGRADLVAYRDMLVGIRNQVMPLVAAGKTLAEVQAAKPTPLSTRSGARAS